MVLEIYFILLDIYFLYRTKNTFCQVSETGKKILLKNFFFTGRLNCCHKKLKGIFGLFFWNSKRLESRKAENFRQTQCLYDFSYLKLFLNIFAKKHIII